MADRRVILIGAGNIAHAHAQALRETPGVELFGVYDPNIASAKSLAKTYGVKQVFESMAQAATSGAQAAHIMTPPDAHLATGMPFVKAGMAVFMEKPLGCSMQECQEIQAAAAASGSVVGVNQNLVYNPAYRQLRDAVMSGSLGRLRHVEYHYAVPLKQLSAKLFGHWMFRRPVNILLEQAVHPLSQIIDLAGAARDIRVLPEAPIEISPGVGLHAASQITMQCERVPAYLRFQVGANFLVCRMTAVCDDGVAVADMFANQFHTVQRTAYLEAVDYWLSAKATARQIASSGWNGLREYALAQIKLAPRSDPFYQGMKGSIRAFHAALDAGSQPHIDMAFGAHLVDVCERVANEFMPLQPKAAAPLPAPAADAQTVAVIGGTGFIGSHTVTALLAQGYAVRVMARGVTNLQPVFYRPGVTLCRGDVKRPEDVARCVEGVKLVVNLAHGGGGADFAAIRAAMVDSAQLVVDACRKAGVQRLVHVGSISGLYLGNPGDVITGSTPADPMPHTRNDYSHAKGLADAVVLKAHGQGGLSTVLLRPGLVVGAGTSPFHGGLGFFNNDQYCVGWNDGQNKLPWVLAEDCATAIAGALTSAAAPGKAYNLVGDVLPSAREYLRDLGQVLGRPLHFVPKSPTGLWAAEMGKWVIKRIAGRNVVRPYRRDIISRGLKAQFDCSDAKRDLGWKPVGDATVFHARALQVHADN
jgi:predicted dehydrogenase/nucleoside-diphosphate-sugar epimerase